MMKIVMPTWKSGDALSWNRTFNTSRIVTPFDLALQEAIDYSGSKGLELSPDSWQDVRRQADVRAFTVAYFWQMEVLREVQGEV